MSSPIRLRHHTDGRVALCFEPDQYHWRIFQRSAVTGRVGFVGSELGPLGAGWSELFVTELPEPDSSLSRAGQLWSLLHNNCSPEGRWSDESRCYYTQVAAAFDRDRAPTQDAYDAAVVALHRHRDRADRAEAELVELRARLADHMRGWSHREEGRHATYICDGGPHTLQIPYPDCPNAEQHAPCPTDYIAWHEWAAKTAKTHARRRCPDCGYLVIYVPKVAIDGHE